MNIQKRTSSNYWLGLWGILYLLLGTHVACTDSGSPNSNPDPGPTVKSTNVTYKVGFANVDKKGRVEELKGEERKDGKVYYQVPVGQPVLITTILDSRLHRTLYRTPYGDVRRAVWLIWENEKPEKFSEKDCFTKDFVLNKPGTMEIRALGFYEDEKGEKPVLINSNQQPCVIQWVEENERKLTISLSPSPTKGLKPGVYHPNLKIENVSSEPVNFRILYNYREYEKYGGKPMAPDIEKMDSSQESLQLKKSETFESKCTIVISSGKKVLILYAQDLEGNILGKVEYEL